MDKLQDINNSLSAMEKLIAEERFSELDAYVGQSHKLFQAIIDSPDDYNLVEVNKAYAAFVELFDRLNDKKGLVSKELMSSIKGSKGVSAYKNG